MPASPIVARRCANPMRASIRPRGYTFTLLDRPTQHALHVIALQGDEDDNARQHRHHDASLQEAPVDLAVLLTLNERQHDGQCVLSLIRQEDKCRKEFIPRGEEREESDRDRTGLRKRQHDLGKASPGAATIHVCTLLKRVRNRGEGVAHDEDRERQLVRDVYSGKAYQAAVSYTHLTLPTKRIV